MRIQRVNAWSSPRNISTAFMYSFAQRPDTRVVDEPLYAHYLTHQRSAADHPGREAILASQEPEGEKVIREVILGPYDRPLVLFKQMTHHLIDLPQGFLGQTDNILLIRDPRAIIASYEKVIAHPDMEDIGVRQQFELFEQLKALGTLKAVVDARELLLNPEGVLRQLCASLDIPFYPAMLRWEAGPRKEDGVWAAHWYAGVHRSTGFATYTPRQIHLTGRLEDLAQACQPYYDQLYQVALKANA